MLEYQYIENIRDRVENILSKLSLHPQYNIEEFISSNKRTYCTPCVFYDGNKEVFIKIWLIKDKYWRLNFKNEFQVFKYLSDISCNIVPKFIDGSIDDGWFLSEFIPQDGTFYCRYPLNINDLYVKLLFLSDEIQKIRIKEDFLASKYLIVNKKFFSDFFIKNEIFIINNNLLNKLEFRQLLMSLDKNGKYIDLFSNVLCHGDFVFKNILIKKSIIESKLVDFEMSRLSNRFFDLAAMFDDSILQVKFQNLLINEYLLRNNIPIEEFTYLFNLDVLFFSIRGVLKLEKIKSNKTLLGLYFKNIRDSVSKII